MVLLGFLVAHSGALAVDESTSYQYDAVGNVLSRTTTQGTATYSYDNRDFITGETGPTTQTLGYDANGNRMNDAGGTLGYGAQSNRLATRYGVSLTYDAAGNITGDGTYTYVYNQHGQVKEARQGANVLATYYYDYRNRRTRKIAGGVTTVYHYDQWDRIVGETTIAGAAQKSYIHRDDGPVAQLTHSGASSQVVYLQPDPLGTPRVGRSATGAVVWRWESDAFGTTAANQDPDGDTVMTVVNLRFPGQYRDAETGLHYDHHRVYAPQMGRYLQSDPIGLAGGFNTYAYANSNPLMFVDPLGLQATGGSGGQSSDARSKNQNCQGPDCKQSYLDCLANCIRANDPLNDLGKLGLTGLGARSRNPGSDYREAWAVQVR